MYILLILWQQSSNSKLYLVRIYSILLSAVERKLGVKREILVVREPCDFIRNNAMQRPDISDTMLHTSPHNPTKKCMNMMKVIRHISPSKGKCKK